MMTAALFLAVFRPFLAMGGYWTEPVEINQGGSNPHLAIDRQRGLIHVVCQYEWFESGVMKNGIQYTVLDSLGHILSQEIIPGTRNTHDPYRYGPAVDVDGAGNPHVVYWMALNYSQYYDVFYTRKDATGWLYTPRTIASNAYRGYMVRIALDGDNRVHIAHSQIMEDEVPRVRIYRIIGSQLTERMPKATPYRVDDRLDMVATNNSRVHVVLGFPDPNHSAITYYTSSNGGTTYEAVENIKSPQCTKRVGAPDVFVDQESRLHFCYGSNYDEGLQGKGSIRYVRYKGTQELNRPVTDEDDLESWKGEQGWGYGAVVASDDGRYVGIGYLTHGQDDTDLPPGDLYMRISENQGLDWAKPELIDTMVGGFDGRDFHAMDAYENHFYVVYSHYLEYPGDRYVKMSMYRNVGDPPPVADAGGPYAVQEGSPLLLDMSGSTDEGTNPGIVEYAWDFDADGVFERATASDTTYMTFPDDYQGSLVLRVKDPPGRTDFDTTFVTVSNVAPVVAVGSDTTIDENQAVNLSVDILDPGEDTHQTTWVFGDGEVGSGESVLYTYVDDGTFLLSVSVEDDDGGVGQDSMTIHVLNLPPTADAGGPYTGSIHEEILFAGSGFDPGPRDSLEYAWDLNRDGVFETPGPAASEVYTTPGQYFIVLRVEDPDGGSDVDTAWISITNFAPSVATIPDQVIDEGGVFDAVLLDAYVSDADQDPEDLTWHHYGQIELLTALNDRILTVAVPDSEWHGTETITLVVTDPGSLMDSTEVDFTVRPVNDPPVLSGLPDFSMDEDDTLRISLSVFQESVFDVDDDLTGLSYWMEPSAHLSGAVDAASSSFLLTAQPNWNGSEAVVFAVADTSGAVDTDTSVMTVHPMWDEPGPFSIVSPSDVSYDAWPEVMVFVWEEATDPDVDDVVTYEWNLRQQGGSGAVSLKQTVIDTMYIYFTDTSFADAEYLWWVIAKDQDGKSRQSDWGTFVIGTPATGVEDEAAVLPDAFRLLQNFPNPFNPETRITFHLPTDGEVTLAIYDMLGRRVRALVEESMPAGIHTVVWDGLDGIGRQVSTGIYLCRMMVPSGIFYRKLMLVR